MTRVRLLRPLAVLVALAATVVLAGCGDDSDDPASSTTASSTTEKATTTTAGESTPGDGSVEVMIGTEKVTLTLQTCTSGSETALDLTAQDESGNTLTIKAPDGTGSVTYRGSSEDREGAVRSVTVQADGTFDLSGILSVADDSAPGPDDLSVTGLCSP
ncbi:hypothetical protein [Dermatobacter hominis]|uniref:hypothetical protein n=1 Tax=Dermatobacter hominis TaxID=2884263 RepID=UPI001D114EC1|nr:hypothetical protein [Dermatobacter hominis]UDY37100.1 hypothetical protein LH044_06070 [Dermatobacter hominis]